MSATAGEPLARVGVLVVTHGEAATDMVHAMARIVGELNDVRALPVPIGEARDVTQRRIEDTVLDMGVDEVLFLVDLEGSTPFNLCCRHCRGRSAVLTGMNMPMLLKLATAPRDGGALHLAEELLKTGQKSIHIRGRTPQGESR